MRSMVLTSHDPIRTILARTLFLRNTTNQLIRGNTSPASRFLSFTPQDPAEALFRTNKPTPVHATRELTDSIHAHHQWYQEQFLDTQHRSQSRMSAGSPGTAPVFCVHDMVYVHYTSWSPKQHKLCDQWYGPCRVTGVSEGAVCVKLGRVVKWVLSSACKPAPTPSVPKALLLRCQPCPNVPPALFHPTCVTNTHTHL